ncbi:kinase A anchor protein [Trichoderma sp. SZMC 28014]
MPPKPSPTHFLCIPLAGMQLANSLASFRADVTSAMSFGLPKDAVRPLGTLHLTLGVMSLSKDGVEKAVDILRGLKLKEILAESRLAKSNKTSATALAMSGGSINDSQLPQSNSSLSLTLRGLHSMQPAAKATVLYAPPTDPAGILYDFCKLLQKPFQDNGLMIDENRPLLLHATIINTIYVKNSGGSGGARGKRREKLTIDARDVLSRYDDYVWAEDVPVTRVALCRMGAKQIEGTDDAAYEVEADVEFES